MSFSTGSRCTTDSHRRCRATAGVQAMMCFICSLEGILTPICSHGIGQRPGRPHTDSGFVFDMQRPIFLHARQEMPPVTSFSMASSCACNKVWLAECNELQIRRLYLRLALHGHHGVAADGSRPQRTYSTIRDRSRTLPVVSLSVLFGRVGAASNKGT